MRLPVLLSRSDPDKAGTYQSGRRRALDQELRHRPQSTRSSNSFYPSLPAQQRGVYAYRPTFERLADQKTNERAVADFLNGSARRAMVVARAAYRARSIADYLCEAFPLR